MPTPSPENPLPAQRLEQQVRFILEVDRLKEIFRQTVLTGSRRRENDAEHSWHLCLCVLVLAEHAGVAGLDVLRVLRMVIVHDLVEIDAGDTFAYDTAAMAGQHEREARAADRIFGLLPEDQAREFRALWDEFEARRTPEARFAAAVDRFQPMLLNAHTEGHAWRKHGVTYPQVMARNAHVAEGSVALWEYAARMVAEAADRGYLDRGPAARIYHLAPRGELLAGRSRGRYFPARWQQDGFVHCAGDLGTLVAVANDYFGALEEPLVALEIDPARLSAPVRFEAPAPLPGAGGSHLESAARFPHVYGPIELDAVTGAAVVPREAGRYRVPSAFLPLTQVVP